MGICCSSFSQEENKTVSLQELKILDSEVKEFSLKGQEHNAKVVYVYDGDTVHIVFNFNNIPTKFNCRMLGIDSPEMQPKNVKDIGIKTKEIEKAIKSRNYLISRVTDQKISNTNMSKKDVKELCRQSRKLVRVKCFEFDKYGRLLIEIYDGSTAKSINQEMIDNSYAVAYDGGTKQEFNENNFV